MNKITYGIKWAGAVSLGVLALAAQSAQLNSSFHQGVGNSWILDLTLVADGSPTEVRGFSAYFADGPFADLLLLGSAASWDSLVIQPDAALASAGFLDAQLLSGPGLMPGQSLGGFSVQFSYLGSGRPPELPFEIVDAGYQVLYSGITTPVTPVPEPASPVLLLLGLGAWGLARRAQAVVPSPVAI